MKSHLIGNWKMNFTVAKSLETAIKIAESLPADSPVCTVVCPQFPALAGVAEVVGGTSLKVGAQNVSHRTEPASTGEVSLEALRDLAEFVLVGHSERRAMGETSRQVAAKACAVGGSGLTAVVCVGESGADRQEGLTENVISQQLQASDAGQKSSRLFCCSPFCPCSVFLRPPDLWQNCGSLGLRQTKDLFGSR